MVADKVLDAGVDPPDVAVQVSLLYKRQVAGLAGVGSDNVAVVQHVVLQL